MCVRGLTAYREPVDAYEALIRVQHRQLSIMQCKKGTPPHYHLVNDGGNLRDIACTTKRRSPSKAAAKRKLKELHRAGRREIVMYECWYSERGKPHFHHGHEPGKGTYYRSGRVYG